MDLMIGAGECSLWTKSLSWNGYGREWDPSVKKARGAHVMTWERWYGPVPEGKELHHICGNRACVNILHLTTVTPKEHAALHPEAGGRRKGPRAAKTQGPR